MDDFQLGLLILGGIALATGLGITILVLTRSTENVESWEWVDWRGRHRTLSGQRKVKPGSDEKVVKL